MSIINLTVTNDNGVVRVPNAQSCNGSVVDGETLILDGSGSRLIATTAAGLLVTNSQIKCDSDITSAEENGAPITYGLRGDTTTKVRFRDSSLLFAPQPSRKNILISELSNSNVIESGNTRQVFMYTQTDAVMSNCLIRGISVWEIFRAPSIAFNIKVDNTNYGYLNWEAGRLDFLGFAATNIAVGSIWLGQGNLGNNFAYHWNNDPSFDNTLIAFQSPNNRYFEGYTWSPLFRDRDSGLNAENVLVILDSDLSGTRAELGRYVTNSNGKLTGTYDSRTGTTGALQERDTLFLLTTRTDLGGNTYFAPGFLDYDLVAIDNFVEIRSYLHQPPSGYSASDSFVITQARGVLNSDYSVANYDIFNLVPDSSITQVDKSVVDAYTTLETPQKLYDRAKAEWRDTDNYPIIARNGNTIDLQSYNLVVDATAVDAYSFVANTITISSPSFVGNLTTTGTVTTANGAIISGVIIDSTANASLVFSGVDSWIVYATEADRNSDVNRLGDGVGTQTYRFNYTPSVTYYLRLTAGTDTILKAVTPSGVGETTVTLSTAGLLTVINSSIQQSSQLAEYGGKVTIDTIAGTDSTQYPFGTSEFPARTVTNGLTLLSSLGLNTLEVRGDSFTPPSTLRGIIVRAGVTGTNNSRLIPTLTLSSLNGADRCVLEGFAITGATNVAVPVFGNEYHKCVISNFSGLTGLVLQSKLAGLLSVVYAVDVIDCYGTCVFNVAGVNANLVIPDFSGQITVAGMTSATARVSIGIVSGVVIIDSSCTAGVITVANADLIVNNTGGATVIEINDSGSSGSSLTAQDIWEYNISAISTPGSAGKVLLDASEAVVTPNVNVVSVNGVAVSGVDDFKADVSAIPTNPLLTTDIRLNNLDTAISSRLASTSYVIPPTTTQINTALSVAHGSGSWATATGFSTFNPATQQVIVGTNNDKSGYSLANGAISSSVIANNAFNTQAFTTGYFNTIGSEVDSALAADARLDNLDVAVSSRLAASSYVAPDNASIGAILADTSELQANQGNWITATGFATPSDVAIALNSYDAPTFTEMTAAFTQIKGAGWATETLRDIRLNLSSSAASPADVYTYFTSANREDVFKADVSGLSTFNPTSDQVVVSVNNDKTGYTLGANAINSVTVAGGAFDAQAFSPSFYSAINGEVDSALSGELRLNNLDVPVSSRMASFTYLAPDNTSIAAILADTNELQQNQGDWATATGFSTFNPATQTVIVGANNDKSGYSLANGAITSVTVAAGALSDNSFSSSYFDRVETAVTLAMDGYGVPTKVEVEQGNDQILDVVGLLGKYHDNTTEYLGQDGVTATTQSQAYFVVVYDDDNSTELKRISFLDRFGNPTPIPNAARYVKV